MTEEKTEKIVIIATHGPDDQERATLPFVMANGALVLDVEAVVILQGNAVQLANREIHKHVFAPGLPPLMKLISDFMELGGKLLVCTPCIKERHLDKEMLVDGSEPIAAARVITEILESNGVLSY